MWLRRSLRASGVRDGRFSSDGWAKGFGAASSALEDCEGVARRDREA